jgi:hypothetical protein
LNNKYNCGNVLKQELYQGIKRKFQGSYLKEIAEGEVLHQARGPKVHLSTEFLYQVRRHNATLFNECSTFTS